MHSRSLLVVFAAMLLFGCQTHPHHIHTRPAYTPPPPLPSPMPAQPEPVKPVVPAPSYTGTAGPLTHAGVGHYMDSLETDLRHYLHGIAVARPGDVIVVNLQDTMLLAHGELTERGRELLKSLAAALAHYDHTGVEVNGYTDTRGTPEDNLKTSQKNAETVAAALREDGIAPKRIAATGFGREHLKVATGAGVSNARNRRIEIRIVAKPD